MPTPESVDADGQGIPHVLLHCFLTSEGLARRTAAAALFKPKIWLGLRRRTGGQAWRQAVVARFSRGQSEAAFCASMPVNAHVESSNGRHGPSGAIGHHAGLDGQTLSPG